MGIDYPQLMAETGLALAKLVVKGTVPSINKRKRNDIPHKALNYFKLDEVFNDVVSLEV